MATQAELSKWLNPKRVARPELRIGMTVRVHQKIKEGEKVRMQIFEGLIIKKSGDVPDVIITVRKVTDGIGVEKIIPVMSSNIDKIDIVKTAKVRRAKLYYMRDRRGKAARLKEVYLTDDERKALMDAQVEITDEAPKGVEVEKADEAEKVEVDAPAEESTETPTEEVKEEQKTEEASVEEKSDEEKK